MEENKTTGFKGFDNNLKCRGYQYEVGNTFECDGKIECCENGFHFCENPFDVFGYYPPSDSRYCSVEGEGETSKDYTDSKVAVSRLHVSAEIGLKGLINAGVKFILDRVKWEEDKSTNTGNRSAATNTGNRSAATNTGDYSAASNTGYQSAATNTGDYSAATNTGYQSAATVEGKDSVAIVTGIEGKAKGSLGCWIVLTERGEWNGETYPIKEVKAFKVDGENIKDNTYYRLIDGVAVKVD